MTSGVLRPPHTYEVWCGVCGGRLRVALPGEPVGCPHCGRALDVPDDQSVLASSPRLAEWVDEGSSIFSDPPLPETGTPPATEASEPLTSSPAMPGSDLQRVVPGTAPLAPPLSGAGLTSLFGHAAPTSAPSAEPRKPSSAGSGGGPDFSQWGFGGSAQHDPPEQAWSPVVADSPVSPESPRQAYLPTGRPESGSAIDPTPPPQWGSESAAAGGPDWPSSVNLPYVTATPAAAFPSQGEPVSQAKAAASGKSTAAPAAVTSAAAAAVTSAAAVTATEKNKETASAKPATAAVSTPKTPNIAAKSRALTADDDSRAATRAALVSELVAEGRVVPRSLFLTAVIFASVATAVALFLLYVLGMSETHQLESLPDVVPKLNSDGTVQRSSWPADAPMPPGHTLHVGESQRFGNLNVTALAVSRESLEFSNHGGGSDTKPAAGQVIKLWLRFTNVSSDQSFAPLDAPLLFFRQIASRGRYQVHTNNFVATADNRAPDHQIYIFDHVVAGDFDLAHQHLGKVLAPGESLVTYIPTETNPPAMQGQQAWRVHLRKGLAANGNGVTTLFEVWFDPRDIQTTPFHPNEQAV